MIPRLTKVAGFEWGSGFYINPVPPEHAAAFLREVEVERPSQRGLPDFERGGAAASPTLANPGLLSHGVDAGRNLF